MGVFAYEAMNSSGQEVKDEIEAATTEEAICQDSRQGVLPDQGPGKGRKEGGQEERRPGRRCRPVAEEAEDADLHRRRAAKATGQFHPPAFHPSGRRSADPAQSADSRTRSRSRGLLKAIIGGVADEVEGGGTLSDAMAKFPKAFDKLYVNMINAGETGGVLDLILARLADFMEKAAKLKKKVIGAMIYPCGGHQHRRRRGVADHDRRDPQVQGHLPRLQDGFAGGHQGAAGHQRLVRHRIWLGVRAGHRRSCSSV